MASGIVKPIVDGMEASFHLIHEAACSSIGFTVPDAASTDLLLMMCGGTT